ncbi:MAG: putative phosphoribosyl transferase [Firmicutes bacterium ADurb.Bin153]|nr:MAG: putative phosphoribosyl transferase [Firmicutes bacterium ADurb.Bin153]
MRFKDRREAGSRLAGPLKAYKGEDVVIYALPRGGVVLGAEIAKALGAPLDLIIPRKIGHPQNPEYAICAVTETGPPICNQEEVEHVDPLWLKSEIERQRVEIRRRREKFLGGIAPKPAEGKVCIIVDDGIATGLTMLAAIGGLKAQRPGRIIVAVPVVPYEIARRLTEEADELVSLLIETNFLGAVGSYYEDFRQTEDDEVIELLKSAEEAYIAAKGAKTG